jgi:hypothetical protein
LQVALRRLDEQVIVHEHIGMSAQLKAIDYIRQRAEEALPVAIVAVDRLAFVTSRGDVVEGTRELDTKRA